MIIRNVGCPEHGMSSATITLSYDEIRCVSNSLCRLMTIYCNQQNPDYTLESNIAHVRAKFLQLFMLVKVGDVPTFEHEIINNLLKVPVKADEDVP